MAEHPLRALLEWPFVLIGGLIVVGILVFAAFGYIADRLDRRRQAIADAECGEGQDAR